METFKKRLASCSEEELEQVFRLWGMNGFQGSSDAQFAALMARIKDPIAARFVFESLSPSESSILYRTLTTSARSGARRDVTLRKLQMREEHFDKAIEDLKSKALLWEDSTRIRSEKIVPSRSSKATPLYEDVVMIHAYEECIDALYTVGKELFSVKSDRSLMSLDKILTTSYPGSELDRVAKHYGGGSDIGFYYSRVDIRVTIEEELIQPTGAFEIIQQLKPGVRDALKWLCQQGGRVTLAALRRQTGITDAELYAIVSTLEEYALAFDTFSEQERVLFIPQTTLESLKQATSQDFVNAGPATFAPLAAPPPAVQDAVLPLLYDLAIIVGAVYQQTIEPTQAGSIPKRIANKLYPLLHGTPRTRYMDVENEYMEMIFNIAQELGILRLVKPVMDGVKAHYEPGAKLAAWARMDITEQTHQLVLVWLKSFSWLDLRGVNFRQWDPYYWNPMPSRISILEQLRKCTPNQWYSVAGLLQAMWDKDPFELRPVRYNARPADKQKTQALRTKWNSCEGEVYIGLLSSTLFEMGLVALGYKDAALATSGKPVNPDYFMLTDLGAATVIQPLADGKTATKASGAKAITTKATASSATAPDDAAGANGHRALILQPNFELLLLQPDMPTLYSILPIAQINQVDVVSRLTLTRNSVLRGMEKGLDIEQMLQVLEEHSQKEVPQNVAYTLRDWVKLYKDVRISQVLLLEVSSEAAADEMCTSPKLQAFGLRKLGPRQVIASNDINLQDLRRILEKEGILVHITGDIVTQQNRYGYVSTYGR